jgi:hypothetical protein
MNISDYNLFVANPNLQLSGSLLNIITDAIADGFKRWLSARDGSVVSVPLDVHTLPAQHWNQIIIEVSALIVALNATEPPSYAGWYEQSVAAFNSKAPSAIQNLNLITTKTFQARFNPQILFCTTIAMIFQSDSYLFLNIFFVFTPSICRCTPQPTLKCK